MILLFKNRFEHLRGEIDIRIRLNCLNLIITLIAIVCQKRCSQPLEYRVVLEENRPKPLQHFHHKKRVDAQIISWKFLNLEQFADVIAH